MTARRTRPSARLATGIGALGVVTAVGLAGGVAPAAAAEAPLEPEGARPPVTGAIPLPSRERTDDVVHTVRAGETVTGIAARYGTTVAAVVAANDLGPRALIQIGQRLSIPASAGAPTSSGGGSASASPESPAPGARYTVRSGDTLTGIAAAHGTSVAALVSANGLDAAAFLHPGQELRLPGSAARPTTPASTSTGASSSSGSSAGSSSHTVRSGDTVSAIAARYGTTVAAVVDANGLSSRALIRIGQVLTIPGASSPALSAPAEKPAPSSSSTSRHTVRTGETLTHIAARYGTTVAAITAANDLGSTVIHPGQVLAVSGTAPKEQLVPSTFLHYTYPSDVVAAANENKHTLLSRDLPGASQMQQIIRSTAVEMGVDPALALAVAHQESGFDAAAVSPANAVGAMQVIPSSGAWASDLVGRDLDLLDPHDNAVAGVAILRFLVSRSPDLPTAIASYYQGLGSVTRNGMYDDTRRYVANIQTLMTRYA